MDASIKTAIEKAGGPVAVAKRLTEAGPKQITSQAISQWDRVPAERARDLSAIIGVPLHELRPDLWPKAETTQATESAA